MYFVKERRERRGRRRKKVYRAPFVCRRHAYHFLKDLDALLQTLPRKMVFDWEGARTRWPKGHEFLPPHSPIIFF